MENEPFESKMPEPPQEGAKLKKVYYQVTKNKKDGVETTTRHPMPIFEYGAESGYDEKHYLTEAEPVKLRLSRAMGRISVNRTYIDLPDMHVGFSRDLDGNYTPLHQPEVLDVALQVVQDVKPNLIVIGGDPIENPELSRFDKDSNRFVDTTQMSINALHKYLCRLREAAPNAEIILLDDNHASKRLKMFIAKNAMALLGLRRANLPDEVPVMTFPHLLRTEELGIKCVTGYPACYYEINERLITAHGEFADARSTASKYIHAYDQNVMFHHDHRRGYERFVYPSGKSVEAFSNGCMANISGALSSAHNGIDIYDRVVQRYMNWHNGFGFGEYQDGDKPYKNQSLQCEPQDNFVTMFEGKNYSPRPEMVELLRNGK